MILDGNKVSKEIINNIKEKVSKLDKKITLAVIEIGNNSSNKIYINKKRKMCEYIGYNFIHYNLDLDIEEQEIIDLINKLNNDDNINSILLQLPLPKQLNENKIKNSIDPKKDVDCLTEINIGKLFNNKEYLLPCTVKGVIELLKYYNIEIDGKNITILGRSNLIGKPLAIILTNLNGTVTLCHSKTKNLKEYTTNADLLITAIGKPNFIKSSDIKDGVVIVDIGINKLENGTICGDVDYLDVKNKVSFITPVPGGVGPMTVALLANNIYESNK